MLHIPRVYVQGQAIDETLALQGIQVMKKIVPVIFLLSLVGCNSTQNNQTINLCERYGAPIDREAAPLVRIEPKYPQDALKNGVKGEVTLSFKVTSGGNTKDIKVISSTPEGVFDQVSVNALKKWKYMPKCINGVNQNEPIETTLTFKKEG